MRTFKIVAFLPILVSVFVLSLGYRVGVVASPRSSPSSTPGAYPIPPLTNPAHLTPSGGNDASQIQIAVNAGDVDILPGRYTITGTVNVPSNRNIRCEPNVVITHPNSSSPPNHDGMFRFNGTSNNSVIGCTLQGTNSTQPPQYNWSVSGYSFMIEGDNTSNLEVAGNTFQNVWGQCGVELFGGQLNGAGPGNIIEYNTFHNLGLYGACGANVSNIRVIHNVSIDAAMGEEDDAGSLPVSNDLYDSNTFQHIFGTGYESLGKKGVHMYLSGGATALNYSGVTVSNNSVVSGPVDLLVTTNPGGRPATYINNTGFNVR